MGVKNRNMRLFGLMAVLTLLLSVSVISCLNGPSRKDTSGSTPVPTPREEPSATVLGTVKNTSNQPIPGAHMKIYNATRSYGPINRNAQGFYSFTVTPDTYTLRAAAVGYGTQTRSVTLSPSETEQQNFTLNPQ